MRKNFGIGLLAGALVMSAMPTTRLAARPDQDDHGLNRDRHVLLISIDGMHAVDYENCVKSGACPTLAALGKTGVTYTRTSTSRPSDSFPGLMALVTGGTPKTVGAYYDVAYDRVLAPPAETTGNGLAAGNCVRNQTNGTQTEYEEGDEFDQTKINGGGPYSSIDGGVLSIDPNKLVRDPFNQCLPVYPWNFIRTNTIYGVIHHAGGYTAWSDKHAVYAAVSGPTGTNSPSNVDDYYSPEVNSNQFLCPASRRPARTLTAARLPPARQRLDHRFSDHPVLRPVEGQRDSERDQRQEPSRHEASASAGDLRDELPGGQRWPEADRKRSQGRLYRRRRRSHPQHGERDQIRGCRDRSDGGCPGRPAPSR